MVSFPFNVRVYGILIFHGKVLVSDEILLGQRITKFPGGGLEYGEGLAESLVREWKEELNIDTTVKKHFYTTDFFVPSIKNDGSQVISVYYLVDTVNPEKINVADHPFDFREEKEGAEAYRWMDLDTLSEEDFVLPVDKVIVRMLNF